MWALVLLAQDGRAEGNPLRRPEVIWGTIGLAVALLIGALVIWLVDRWRKRNAAAAVSSAEELTDFRGMYERGEITEDEYIKLRTRVAARVKSAVGVPPPPTPPIDPANPPPPA